MLVAVAFCTTSTFQCVLIYWKIILGRELLRSVSFTDPELFTTPQEFNGELESDDKWVET
jgi:hypothetical protein